jgi:hypothetical protein
VLNSRVASVQDGYVRVVNKAGEETEVPFGACVWATGIAMNPLLKSLQEVLPGQTHFRCAAAAGPRAAGRGAAGCAPPAARGQRAAPAPCPPHHPSTPAPQHPRARPPPCTPRRSILTDELLRAKGSDGSIFVLGDASTIDQPKALDLADELFEKWVGRGCRWLAAGCWLLHCSNDRCCPATSGIAPSSSSRI